MFPLIRVYVCVTVQAALLVSPPKTIRSKKSYGRVTQRLTKKKQKLAKETSVLISSAIYFIYTIFLFLFFIFHFILIYFFKLPSTLDMLPSTLDSRLSTIRYTQYQYAFDLRETGLYKRVSLAQIHFCFFFVIIAQLIRFPLNKSI